MSSRSLKGTAKQIKELSAAFLDHLSLTVGRVLANSTSLEQYRALSYVLRHRIVGHWIETIHSYRERVARGFRTSRLNICWAAPSHVPVSFPPIERLESIASKSGMCLWFPPVLWRASIA